MTTALAVAAALVALLLAMALTERWLLHRRPYEATWALSLLFFSLGAAALAWGSSAGWSAASFRTFYLFGAIVNVPFLAAGQLEFTVPKTLGRRARAIAGLLAAGMMATAPFSHAVPGDRLPRGSEVLGVAPRVLAASSSGIGAVIVFVATAVATVRLRQRRENRRALGTGCIALGTIVLSSSGLLNSTFGEMRAFSITLTAGVIILFAGFVFASGQSEASKQSDVTSARGE
jgi:hypothetical protein